MVDELAGWKAVLGRRCRETEAALKALLTERRQVTEQLHAAARSVSAVRSGFRGVPTAFSWAECSHDRH